MKQCVFQVYITEEGVGKFWVPRLVWIRWQCMFVIASIIHLVWEIILG
jgi:hypothetical protein